MGDLCDGPFSAVTADFDGDGRPDVAYSCIRGAELAVLSNGGGRDNFAFTTLNTARGAWLATGDLTGDGVADIVGLTRERSIESTMTLVASDRAGGFEEHSRQTVAGHTTVPYLEDTDRDGGLDVITLAWHGRPPGRLTIWPSDCAR